jgi:hypothetical protein
MVTSAATAEGGAAMPILSESDFPKFIDVQPIADNFDLTSR